MSTEKFKEMKVTAKGEERAFVDFKEWKNLWFNTGTLCNLECTNCYIESSPKNDQLSYITTDDVTPYLKEIKENHWDIQTIGFTGGEPFLNPNMINILSSVLEAGFNALVLTNAYNVIKRWEKPLLELKDQYGDKLRLRISLDHYTARVHEQERGKGTFDKTLQSLKWLFDSGFSLSVAGRSLINESTQVATEGYQNLLKVHGIDIDLASDKLVVFPEMKTEKDVPEITTACWGILSKRPDDQMCASERMIVKKKGQERAVVQPCTLLAYDQQFEMGQTLKDSMKPVYLNHRFCAEFCVLGGASCSSTN
ncbi:MAG: radical SAM protein [Deltaproteobacteria bacterium]|nr:MAG: radical SAM protein [Deltaproteobacteria bacterium]